VTRDQVWAVGDEARGFRYFFPTSRLSLLGRPSFCHDPPVRVESGQVFVLLECRCPARCVVCVLFADTRLGRDELLRMDDDGGCASTAFAADPW
jgi:hypothetical protein